MKQIPAYETDLMLNIFRKQNLKASTMFKMSVHYNTIHEKSKKMR
ncbi:MAG TPA: hypothetical protein PKC41_03720 [Chitinophagaceae bacterium]|jgi:hypothetical protein|nr:hypothetical protein [Chitinophagaceae bacterium]HQW47083.1 hypothetical protein [Chitinophagaceae bacterium]